MQLLDRFGAQWAGNALVVRRADLLARLRALAEDPALSFERERHAQTLAEAHRDALGELLGLAAQRLQNQNRTIAEGEAAARQRVARFGHFPAGVDLTKTTLRIEFQGLQDFLQKIGTVVYALQNDLEVIEAFIESADCHQGRDEP